MSGQWVLTCAWCQPCLFRALSYSHGLCQPCTERLTAEAYRLRHLAGALDALARGSQ